MNGGFDVYYQLFLCLWQLYHVACIRCVCSLTHTILISFWIRYRRYVDCRLFQRMSVSFLSFPATLTIACPGFEN
jgi:hypothetical protein